MNIRKQIGLNLQRLRIKRGMTQEAVALEADIAANYMNGIERGKRNPTIDIMGRIARALRVPVAAFFAFLPPPCGEVGAARAAPGGGRAAISGILFRFRTAA